jgi:hypothetical protein
VRQPKRTDENQARIVAALRKAGVTVTCTHEVGRGYPDLACGARGLTLVGDFDRAEVARRLAGVDGLTVHLGANVLLEVKNPEAAGGWRMTPAEKRWHKRWRGAAVVVETAAEALAACGKILKNPPKNT